MVICVYLKLINHTEEFRDAANYPTVRMYKIHHMASPKFVEDISAIDTHWSKPSQGTTFLERLISQVEYPLGKTVIMQKKNRIVLMEFIIAVYTLKFSVFGLNFYNVFKTSCVSKVGYSALYNKISLIINQCQHFLIILYESYLLSTI